MRTAMQELLDYIDTDANLNEISDKMIDLLKKEKAQIIQAHKAANILQGSPEWKHIEAENYYNSTYR